jgi:predicted NBD/HSP70 family sugar kinase
LTLCPSRGYRPYSKEGFLTIGPDGVAQGETTADRTRDLAGHPQLLRALNERRVLDVVRSAGAISRAEIARRSGLSKPTVSLALDGLLAARLVHHVGHSTGSKGPRAKLFELDPGSGWVVGVDVGRRWVRAAVADITGAIVARRDERTRLRSARTLVTQIGELAHRVTADAGIEWKKVTHATVGSPGVLVPSSGLLEQAPNLPGWGERGVVEAIRDRLGTAVTFENDVNLAALGERAHGAGREVEDFVFIWVGTGLGMGIVIGGRLYRGSRGGAGEIAYLPVVPDGAPAGGAAVEPGGRRADRGALEEATAASAVTGLARARGMTPPLSPKRVFAAARRGDETACAVVAEEARRLAYVIAAVVPVLDPELVVLGGGVGANGDLLLGPVERHLRELSPFSVRLAVSELGEEAVLAGAVATALEAAQDRLFSRTAALERKQRSSEVHVQGEAVPS